MQIPGGSYYVQPATTVAAVATPAPLAPEKPKFSIPAEDYADWLNVLLTHPTAFYIEEVKVTPAKPAEKKTDKKDSSNKKPEVKEAEVSASPSVEIQAGMVVSLGPDSTRLFVKFLQYLTKAKKAGADSDFTQIKINGETWYRYTPPNPCDKNPVTFGFHGKYLVVGVGDKAVEGILARWNSPTPAWLTRALEQTRVPRRTGIIYLNLKALRDKLLPLAPSQKDAVAILELLGLYNLDSLVSTTGLEDDGMINRVLLTMDGKPRGLLDMVADRPLAAKDLEPIPRDAMLAVAARVDLDRAFKVLLAAYEKMCLEKAAGEPDVQKAIEGFKKDAAEKIKQEYGIDVFRVLSSVGDTWCAYNSPAEGQIIFLGWTAVVSVRDRAALVDCWEKLCAAQEKKKAQKDRAKDKDQGDSPDSGNKPLEFRKCHFAGHEIYYAAGELFPPVVCITDHEMVMTLSMPAMKAYLMRKNHRSLAAVPGVALALNEPNPPAVLGYCDTPRVFEFLYPLFSMYAAFGASGAQQLKFDLDPTFWPSAAALSPHLRADITTLQRTPQGLQLTCRYCLPSGGVNGPLWAIALGTLWSSWSHLLPSIFPEEFSSDPTRRPQEVIEPALATGSGQVVPPCLPAAQSNSSAPTPYGTAPPTVQGYGSYPSVAPASQYPAYASPVPTPSPGVSTATNPYIATPVASPYSSAATAPHPAYAGPAATPAAVVSNPPSPPGTGAAPTPEVPKHKVTTADIIALTRADVDEALIINHIRSHGLAAPVQAGDAIYLQQQGVSRKVIEVMRTQPVAKSRVILLSQDQEAEILKAIGNKPFADYWQFTLLSGCRPDEGARVEAKHLVETPMGLQAVLEEHKSARKTGKVRVAIAPGFP